MRKWSVFKNDALNQDFRSKGYVKLSWPAIEKLKGLKHSIAELNPSDGFKGKQIGHMSEQDYHCTFFDENQAYRDKVQSILNSLFSEVLTNVLNDYKTAQCNFFVKPPHEGYVYPHQNLTIVDEDNFTSVSIWCPLQDTNVDNGTMMLIPGSHNKFAKWRNTNICWPLLEFSQKEGKQFFEPVEVPFGEFLVLDDSIIHFTDVNHSSRPRVVAHALCAPNEAELIYCDVDEQSRIVSKYLVSDTFWQNYRPGSIPEFSQVPELLPYDDRSYDFEGFVNELES